MSLTVFDRVKKVLVECLPDIKEGQIVPIASFIDDLRMDSLDTVELVMGLEDEFEIDIPDEISDNLKTIQNAIDYIATRTKG